MGLTQKLRRYSILTFSLIYLAIVLTVDTTYLSAEESFIKVANGSQNKEMGFSNQLTTDRIIDNAKGQPGLDGPDNTSFSKNSLNTVQNEAYSNEEEKYPDLLGEYKTDRFIVKYKDGIQRDAFINKVKDNVKKVRSLKNKRFDIIYTKTRMKNDEILSAIKMKNADLYIDYIQPDYEVTLSSNDPYFDSQWGIYNKETITATVQEAVYETKEIQYRVDANVVPAWEYSQGEGVTVAVIDTGIDITHEDLSENIWRNENEIPGNGIDDDGNGYIDDVNGWNFCDDSGQVFDSSLASSEEHGTHIAGIIAAVKDNGIGIAGVAPKAKIMPLKVFTNGTAYTSDIIESIEYAEKIGVRIANCSWGTTNENPALKEVMEGANILFVCAAGNSGTNIDINPVYPASFASENIISVASINRNGMLSGFSNYGEGSVDVAAPGEDIYSTVSGSVYGYEYKSGTSMAAAFVSGEAVLIASSIQGSEASELRQKLIDSSDRLSSILSKVYRGNKINSYNAVSNITNDQIIQIGNISEVSLTDSVYQDTEEISLFTTTAFNQPWDTQPYSSGSTTVISNAGGILKVSSTTNDPILHMYNLGSFDPEKYRYIEIRYKMVAGAPSTFFQIYFTNSTYTTVYSEDQVVNSKTLIADGQWHTYYLDMWTNPNYKTGGNITGWRYDWSTASGVTMELDYIRLVDDKVGFSQPWDTQPYTTASTTVVSNTGGILKVNSTTNDPMIHMYNLGSFDPSIFRYIEIRYKMASGSPPTKFQVYFTNSAYTTVYTEEQVVKSSYLQSSGIWYTYYLDMWANTNYKTGGDITGWRYDWATASGVTMELDYIRLVDKKAEISSSGSPTSNFTFKVYANNVGKIGDADVKIVKFPTWTSTNSQDDIVWHEGKYLGNDNWEVTIDTAIHNYEVGEYITHIYAFDIAGNSSYLGGINTVVDRPLLEYIYDANNRLIQIIRNGVSILQFNYDNNGNLISKTIQ